MGQPRKLTKAQLIERLSELEARDAERERALLDLEVIEANLFRGQQPDTMMQRVFGGQVAAHALVAASRTVPERYTVHSLHSYFLRPGDTSVPIVYDVETLREGRSFATRRVLARQHGRPIFVLSANFQVAEEGLDHQDAMPACRGQPRSHTNAAAMPPTWETYETPVCGESMA